MPFKDFDDYDYAKKHDGYIPMEFKTNEKGTTIVFNEKYCFACGTIEKPANGLFTVIIYKWDPESRDFAFIAKKIKSFKDKQTIAMSVEYEGGPGEYMCEVTLDAKTGPGQQKVSAKTTITFPEEE